MIAFVIALLAAVAVPPKPATYVTDKAGVLDAAKVHALNERLAQFERDTSNQILVYVDRSLPNGVTIEQFANDAMHQWGVGRKGKDNGAVLFLFTADRKMRIEVGYGLEGVLTDAKSKQITSSVIKPRLKANDYDGAVAQGVDVMLTVVSGEGLKGSGQTAHEKGARGNSGFVKFIPLIFILLIGLIIVIVRAVRAGPRRSGWKSSTDRDSSWSSFSSSSSSSSDSFSDSSSSSDSSFDGGGGDSGGGGASDSW